MEKDIPGTGGGGVGWSSEISVVDEGCCGTLLGSGRVRASATTFSRPGRWRISQLNSDRNDNLLCCIGSDLLLAELDETAGIDSRVEESRRREPATSTRRWL